MPDDNKPRGSGATSKVVPLFPTKRTVAEHHLPNLRASGLSDETIELAELYSEDRRKVLAQLVERRSWPSNVQGSAIVFPFYLPGQTEAHNCRLRPSKPRAVTAPNGKTRLVKYDQASSAGMLVYFPPRARIGGWYAGTERTLYWTEGEKKALVLDQENLPCVGLTGVWNWVDKDHKDRGNGERLHPHITEHVTIAGRAHVIVFDADAQHNDQVMLAAQRLCGLLLAAGAASVRFVCPPDVAEQKGIDDYYAAHGGEAMHALLATATDLEPADPKQPLIAVRRCKAYRDAPIDPALLVPEGYELRRDGSLWSTAGKESLIAQTPIFVTRVLADRYSCEHRVEITWPGTDGEWPVLGATMRAIRDSRVLVSECGPYGAPISSANAGRLVEWFSAFEHCNGATIPRFTSVANTGWHMLGDVRVFALDETIGPEQAHETVVLDKRGDRAKMVAALTPRGTLEAHVDALRRAWDASPVAACAIAGALATPLLQPLAAPNFAIHLWGESSRGKSSQLKIAASVYGNPASPQWLPSWNVTMAGLELRAAQLNDLPQCYDEIGGGDVQAAERMVYTLINGGGRTRATRDLTMRETASWRTVALSTGERELADESAATGAQVRVVQLPVDGFGELSASEIDALTTECAAHSGSLGHAWLRELVNIDDWDHYRKTLTQLTAAMRGGAAADPLQARVAAYFALLSLTEAMVAESFRLGKTTGHTFKDLLASIGSRERVQGLAERAREAVESWVVSEPDAFPMLNYSPHGGLEEPKSNGVRTRHGFKKPDGTILIISGQFRQFCAKRARLASRAVVREWLRLGWTEVEYGRLDKQIRIGTQRARYVVLTPLPNTRSDAPEDGAQ